MAKKILQSKPYPTYTTTERDALIGIVADYSIHNSTTGTIQTWNGTIWIDNGTGGVVDISEKVDKITGYSLVADTEITKIHGVNDTNTTSNTYADSKVEDLLVDGVTTKAPSQNIVFDNLATKVNKIKLFQTITSGVSATIDYTKQVISFDPSTAIATYTLTMPLTVNLYDGQEFIVIAGGTITSSLYVINSFTLTANTGQVVLGNYIYNLVSGDEFRITWNATNSKWIINT